jgi:hypothetical protein
MRGCPHTREHPSSPRRGPVQALGEHVPQAWADPGLHRDDVRPSSYNPMARLSRAIQSHEKLVTSHLGRTAHFDFRNSMIFFRVSASPTPENGFILLF